MNSTVGAQRHQIEGNYIHYDTSLETVQAAVQKELNEPGKILGYRAINQKLRMQHELQVQRNLVHKMLQKEDPEGLQFFRPTSKNKEKKRFFSCDGPLDVASFDGHEKLCGYQNWTFPLGVYECLDAYPRKVLFL